ncbi:MAG: lipid-binding SYLF domain-containing protein [Pyrinomonadaceae bacterium]
MNKKLTVVFLTAILLALGASVSAQKVKNLDKGTERVNEASKVMSEIMSKADNAIPQYLLDRAEAVVVFPGAVKAGFIIGGQGGNGVAIKRMNKTWSAPAFVKMAGGSFGAQIGAQKTDYILLIMNEGGLKSLLSDKFEIGGEGSVAAGPVGRTASASTDAKLDAEILTYSRSKGLFAGVALKGVVISPDNDLNRDIYQKEAVQLLGSPGVDWSQAPASLQRFPKTVSSYSK